MKGLLEFIFIALILVGLMYLIDKVIRSIFGVKKDSKFNMHVNGLHRNLDTLLTVILFILIYINNSYNFISNITAIVIFITSVFSFHSIMQKIFLKESKEHIITFFTGVILTSITGIILFVIG